MAALSALLPTYLDFASREDTDGKITAIIELAARTNEILQDCVPVEGNLQTGHKTTIRTGLPGCTWRLLNYGVQPSKSITSQVVDTCGMLEAYAEVDKALADLNGNTAAWRLSEDSAFLSAMNNAMATAMFYGDQMTNPEQFTGLMPRYPQFRNVVINQAISAYNCLNNLGAGVATETSIWLVVWGPETCHAIYPKGSAAGFSHENLGRVTLTDSATPAGRFEGYRTHYKWDIGLTVRDWHYVVRICNIDSATITAGVQTVVDNMIRAYYCVPNIQAGNACWYMNPLVLWSMVLQARATPNMMLTWEDWGGKAKIPTFMGIPIRRCDAILNTEAVALTS
jgi:hypothetical protein